MPGTPELDDCSSLDLGASVAPGKERVSGIAPVDDERSDLGDSDAAGLRADEKREHLTVDGALDGTRNQGLWQRRADEAMTRYSRGDNDAFPPLYDALSPKLYAFLLRRVGSASTANDILQQTFLQLHVHRGHFIPGSSVAAYAFAICRRLCIDLKRRARPELPFSGGDAGSVLDALMETGGADRVMDAKAALAIVRRELESLKPEQYELFELVYLDGFSHAHVAGILGITTNAVKLRANRLRLSIAQAVERAAPAR
jgi:RNA polymerase sigma-70 factor (ECF subfamily)